MILISSYGFVCLAGSFVIDHSSFDFRFIISGLSTYFRVNVNYCSFPSLRFDRCFNWVLFMVYHSLLWSFDSLI